MPISWLFMNPLNTYSMALIVKQFKFKINRDVADTIRKVIDETLEKGNVQDDNDRLLFAALAEVSHLLYMKLGKGIMELKLTLTPTQAIALRLFYFDYINDFTSYAGNKLFSLSNKIAKEMGI